MKLRRYKIKQIEPYQILLGINVLIFILLTILSFILANASNLSQAQSYLLLLTFGGNNSQLILSEGQIYRLLSSMFLHGSITHLAFNMFSLYQLGPLVTQLYSKKSFYLIYFVSGLIGSIFSIALQNQILSVGSSGAIFGLMGALFVWAIINKKREAINVILINVIINIALGLSLPNIDNLAHLGGFVGGVVVGYIVLKKRGRII
jgi:rhomboid protease GluP